MLIQAIVCKLEPYKFGEMITEVKNKPSTYRKQQRISWEQFQEAYLVLEDNYKYEWLNGIVEKTERTMNDKQIFILYNLVDFLNQLPKHKDGQLIAEVDAFFNENHRRPDIAYYTKRQIKQRMQGETVVPKFVIEIISTNDQINTVYEKMKDYRAAGVEVVWHIFPKLQEVHVLKAKEIRVCQDEDICSAEPVIKDFKISVQQIFEL